MSRTVFVLILLTATLSSCAPASLPQTPAAKTANPLPEVTHRSVATSPLPTRQVPAMTATAPSGTTVPASVTPVRTALPQPVTIISPPVEKRCPDQPDVPLSDLGLNESTRLIVTPDKPYENINSWMLIDATLKTRHVFAYIPTENVFTYWISPNKQWVALMLKNDDDNYSLWIASIDGQQRKRLLGEVRYSTWFRWTSDQTLVAFDYDASAPILRLHPFTTPTMEELEPVFLDLEFYAYDFNPDASKLIYLTPIYLKPAHWVLYDYLTGVSKAAFPEMDFSQIEGSYNVFVNWRSENFSLAVVLQNRLELALNVPADILFKQEFPEYQIIFSEGNWWNFIEWWSAGNRYIAFDRDFSLVQEGPYLSYILDTERWVLYDYCIDARGMRFSADERFFATTEYEGERLKGTTIVDVSSGKRALLKGVNLVDWAEVKGNIQQ
jgi:hypothetical protein